ncbi:DUF4251 domain-containing protein [Chryseobacterium salivictor]|uniref:DUF4251 domain-containing protein n=1 Tax=Chryseobacterium salivictor TaxID=2547600 RepID=A0A4P6ZDJ4_9FLAO|nr:DUF4251 domain-containing protein [Chryseobacterium salivictor]QBO57601.1 hypothetical protein NBC122_00766 [Chryseobacterium salivictor]
MKNLPKILIALLTITLVLSCSSQNNIPSANTSALLQSNEFTFVAEHANPNNADVINVLNSLPNGSSQMLNLDSGYTIEIRKDKIDVTLPYFGRMYTPNIDPSKNSYRFTSKDFTITKKEGKKGSSVFNIIAKDQQNIITFNMEVFKNGKTYVSVDSNDRQPISYDGYITANSTTKN